MEGVYTGLGVTWSPQLSKVPFTVCMYVCVALGNSYLIKASALPSAHRNDALIIISNMLLL